MKNKRNKLYKHTGFYDARGEFSPTVTDIDAHHLTASFPREMREESLKDDES